MQIIKQMINTKSTFVSLGVLAVLLAAGWTYYLFSLETEGKTYRAWHYERTATFKELRQAFHPISEMAKGDLLFDAKLITTQSQQMREVASELPELFRPVAPWGEASEEIWSENSEFNALMANFIEQIDSLSGESFSDQQQLRPVVDALRQSCIDCHKRYRD